MREFYEERAERRRLAEEKERKQLKALFNTNAGQQKFIRAWIDILVKTDNPDLCQLKYKLLREDT